MAIRSRDFVGIAEGIKSHELSAKGKIEQLKGRLSELTGRKSSLDGTISYLEAAIAAAYEDTDEDGDPDYGLIASLEAEKGSAENELAGVEQDLDSTSGELEQSESELEGVLEEKAQTLFEIQERARTTSQNIALAGGMYGAYSGVGGTLQNSMQTSLSALTQAAGILGGTVDGNGVAGGGNTTSGAGNSASSVGSNPQSELSTCPLAAFAGNKTGEGTVTAANLPASQFSSGQIDHSTPGTLPSFHSGQSTVNTQKLLNFKSDQGTNEFAINAFNPNPEMEDLKEEANPNRFITGQVSTKTENQILEVPHSDDQPITDSILVNDYEYSTGEQMRARSFSNIAEKVIVGASVIDAVSGLAGGVSDAIQQPNIRGVDDLIPQVAIVSSETNNGGITADDAINNILSGVSNGDNHIEEAVIDIGQAIESIGSDIDQQAGVVFDPESRIKNITANTVIGAVTGSTVGGHSKHRFFDWINPQNYTSDGRYIGEGKEWGYKPYGEDASTFQDKTVRPEVLALNQYMSQKGYSKYDASTYVIDPLWQSLHKEAYGDASLSGEIAFAQLQNYMNSHNYTVFDYGIYMLDPEWQRLSRSVYGEQTNNVLNPVVARKLLQEYMFSYGYSEADYDIYSKDPTWIQLHRICYGEKAMEKGQYKHISKIRDVGVEDIARAENGTLLLLTTPDGFERKYTKTGANSWTDDYGSTESDLSIKQYIEDRGFKGVINDVSKIPFFENSTSLNEFQGMMRGKDVTGIVKSGKMKANMTDIAKVQGFDQKPKLVGLDEFQASVERSGILCFRTWSDGIDVSTKERKKSETFKDEFSDDSKFVHNGSGGQVYGAGIYLTATISPHRGFSPNEERIEAARNGSVIYGKAKRKKATWATACITINQDAMIVDGHSLQEKFKTLSFAEKLKYKMDVGKYAIALGYDGAIWKTSFGCDYYTVYNRSSLIVLDDPGNVAYGID